MAKPKLKQLTIFPRGGERPGAGRKPAGPRPRVSHARRPRLTRDTPVLVTVRMREGLPSLRGRPALEALVRAFAAGAERPGFRLVQFSVQTNHLHLLVEAHGAAELARGMHSLLLRVRHALRRVWSSRGALSADRYHARALRTPGEVRNALVYVLHNARRHGWRGRGADPCSSAAWLDGWSGSAPAQRGPRPVALPRSWLVRAGWKRRGLLDVDEAPAIAGDPRRKRESPRLRAPVPV